MKRSIANTSFAIGTSAALLVTPLWFGSHRPVEHVQINQACEDVASGVTTVAYSQEKLVARTWEFKQDDGQVKLFIRQTPNGRWKPVPTVSGGEGRLRFDAAAARTQGLVWDQYRVRSGEYYSSPSLINFRCPIR